jgi:hypothetical protein
MNLSETNISSLATLCSMDPYPDLIPRAEKQEELFPKKRSASALSIGDVDSIYSEDEFAYETRLHRNSSVTEPLAERLSYLQKLDLSHNRLSHLALPIMNVGTVTLSILRVSSNFV